MPNVKLKNHLHLHFIVFIWGFTAILGNLISLSALPLVWIRMNIAIVCVFILMLIFKKKLVTSIKTIAMLLAFGSIIAMHWVTFYHAIKISNISITLACISTGAFFTSLLEPIFFKRKVIYYEVLLGLLVISGLFIIFKAETQYSSGIYIALTSASLSAIFSIINGKLAHRYDSLLISFYELIGGVIFLTFILIFYGEFHVDTFQLKGFDWLWLFILGSVCTAYPFFATIDIMKYLSPYTVMLTINLEPIYGTILAVMLFSNTEKMKPEFYLGAILILLSVILNAYFKNRKKTIQS